MRRCQQGGALAPLALCVLRRRWLPQCERKAVPAMMVRHRTSHASSQEGQLGLLDAPPDAGPIDPSTLPAIQRRRFCPAKTLPSSQMPMPVRIEWDGSVFSAIRRCSLAVRQGEAPPTVRPRRTRLTGPRQTLLPAWGFASSPDLRDYHLHPPATPHGGGASDPGRTIVVVPLAARHQSAVSPRTRRARADGGV